jgi:hypothetical protein
MKSKESNRALEMDFDAKDYEDEKEDADGNL